MIKHSAARLLIHWVPVAMLILALGAWPYGYFTLLRVVVCFAALLLAYDNLDNYNRTGEVAPWWLAFIPVAILFNPLFPIHLTQGVWAVIDLAVAALFVTHFFKGPASPMMFWERETDELGEGWYRVVARVRDLGRVIEFTGHFSDGPYSRCLRYNFEHILHHGPRRSAPPGPIAQPDEIPWEEWEQRFGSLEELAKYREGVDHGKEQEREWMRSRFPEEYERVKMKRLEEAKDAIRIQQEERRARATSR